MRIRFSGENQLHPSRSDCRHRLAETKSGATSEKVLQQHDNGQAGAGCSRDRIDGDVLSDERRAGRMVASVTPISPTASSAEPPGTSSMMVTRRGIFASRLTAVQGGRQSLETARANAPCASTRAFTATSPASPSDCANPLMTQRPVLNGLQKTSSPPKVQRDFCRFENDVPGQAFCDPAGPLCRDVNKHADCGRRFPDSAVVLRAASLEKRTFRLSGRRMCHEKRNADQCSPAGRKPHRHR